jgi:hypothetical protein
MTLDEEWLRFFADDPTKIDAERRRLEQLRDLLWSAKPAEIQRWTSVGADGYVAVTTAMTQACGRAAGAHDMAAQALDRYQHTLTCTRELAQSALADIRQDPASLRAQAAHESLPRWRDQLRSEAATAAAALNLAAEELAQIRRVVPARPEPAPRTPATRPEPVTAPDRPHEPHPVPVAAKPRTDLLSMLPYARPVVVRGREPVDSWVVWQRAPGRQIGRFGENNE